jgi:hypothetical protein
MKARVLLSCLLVVPSAFAYACGGSDDSSTNDGGMDANTDGTTGNDGQPSNDGAGNDTSSDAGGMDTGTDTGPTDGGVESSFACTVPSDCTNEFCCGTVVFNGGVLPHCDVKSESSACKATCKADIALSCNATETLRGCATTSDCIDAGTGYTKCCTVPFGDASPTFCWTSNLAGLVGGTCM